MFIFVGLDFLCLWCVGGGCWEGVCLFVDEGFEIVVEYVGVVEGYFFWIEIWWVEVWVFYDFGVDVIVVFFGFVCDVSEDYGFVGFGLDVFWEGESEIVF